MRENNIHKLYKVESSTNGEVPKVWQIVNDKVLDIASCSYKKFENEGILCKHILA